VFPRIGMLAILSLAWAVVSANEEANSKTVLGPSNIFLYDGANALKAGDAEEGVRLTLQGLKTATNRREEKIGHANLCAGFLLVSQYETALEHCNWVIERDPNHWRTYNNRAIVYLRMERFEESEADIRKGQELNPKSENLKEVKGMYLDEVEPVQEHITIDDRRDGKTPEVEGDK
jgi:tetratricopeptide (TPR) repeat protein